MSIKIHDNIFFENLDYDSMYIAYRHTKRGKTYKPETILFDMKLEYNIKKIVSDLKQGKYVFGKYREFYVYEPKKRRILSAPFKDRVVHTWYVKNFLEKYFVPTFLNTSYACLTGKGMHKCALDMQKWIYTCSYLSSYKDAYILKMDIAKYFNNIDRNILFDIISRKIYDKNFLNLTSLILDSSRSFDEKLGIGLPIGNYTSQMFANIYLNEADKYLKHTLKCKYISRYMDDTIVILENKEYAKYVLYKIIEFLENKLKLRLNSKTNIFKLSQGVNYCGYKINKYGLKVRSCGKKKIKVKLKNIDRLLRSGKITTKDAKTLLAGNIGYAKIANLSKLLN